MESREQSSMENGEEIAAVSCIYKLVVLDLHSYIRKLQTVKGSESDAIPVKLRETQ